MIIKIKENIIKFLWDFKEILFDYSNATKSGVYSVLLQYFFIY